MTTGTQVAWSEKNLIFLGTIEEITGSRAIVKVISSTPWKKGRYAGVRFSVPVAALIAA